MYLFFTLSLVSFTFWMLGLVMGGGMTGCGTSYLHVLSVGVVVVRGMALCGGGGWGGGEV